MLQALLARLIIGAVSELNGIILQDIIVEMLHRNTVKLNHVDLVVVHQRTGPDSNP